IEYLYQDPTIQDFYLSYFGKENFANYENLAKFDYKFVNYFKSFLKGNGFLITDSTSDSNLKEIRKKPFVFPVTKIINDTSREYNTNTPVVDGKIYNLKEADYSYFDVCLSNDNKDIAIKQLYNATPESKVFTKKIEKNGNTYEITYKVLTMQFKYSGELGMGKDLGSFASIPEANRINLGTFMNTNPLFIKDGIEIPNFLSSSIMEKSPGLTLWNNDYGSSTITKNANYSFKIFKPSNVNLLKYNENGASNNNYELEDNIINGVNQVKNEEPLYQKLVNESNELIFETGKTNQDSNLSQKSLTGNNNIYLSPSCPIGYSLYDDYVPFYKELYK
ncbi:MAG: hypothetical protein Q9M94_03495, partial [Candidatus Gracilibacteria bacterium]|nr:hypothetical protein [Candidatus Gracilibacteria bacterium]